MFRQAIIPSGIKKQYEKIEQMIFKEHNNTVNKTPPSGINMRFTVILRCSKRISITGITKENRIDKLS
jgi:hypothetical protein